MANGDKKYRCRDCGKHFMGYASSKKDRFGTPVCPHCHKEPANLERVE